MLWDELRSNWKWCDEKSWETWEGLEPVCRWLQHRRNCVAFLYCKSNLLPGWWGLLCLVFNEYMYNSSAHQILFCHNRLMSGSEYARAQKYIALWTEALCIAIEILCEVCNEYIALCRPMVCSVKYGRFTFVWHRHCTGTTPCVLPFEYGMRCAVKHYASLSECSLCYVYVTLCEALFLLLICFMVQYPIRVTDDTVVNWNLLVIDSSASGYYIHFGHVSVWAYVYPCWPSGSADWQYMQWISLPGTYYSGWWQGVIFQYTMGNCDASFYISFSETGAGKCSKGCFCGLSVHCAWYASWNLCILYFHKKY